MAKNKTSEQPEAPKTQVAENASTDKEASVAATSTAEAGAAPASGAQTTEEPTEISGVPRRRKLGTGAIIGISAAGLVIIAGSAGAGFAAGVAVSHSSVPGMNAPGQGGQLGESGGRPGGGQGHMGQPPGGMNRQQGTPPNSGSQGGSNSNHGDSDSSSDSDTQSNSS